MNAIYATWVKSISGQAAQGVSRSSKAGARGRGRLAFGIQPLESRTLMSAIPVASTFATPNYLSSVTLAQLDPIDTAATLRDAVNAAAPGLPTVA